MSNSPATFQASQDVGITQACKNPLTLFTTLTTFLENIAFESGKVERGAGWGTEKVREEELKVKSLMTDG